VKDEIVTSTGFTNATPQRKVLFIDRVTGYSNGFEGVITKVMYNQSINSTSVNTCVMQSTIETRVVKVGDFVIIKEEYILYKGNPFEHVFIFLSIYTMLMVMVVILDVFMITLQYSINYIRSNPSVPLGCW